MNQAKCWSVVCGKLCPITVALKHCKWSFFFQDNGNEKVFAGSGIKTSSSVCVCLCRCRIEIYWFLCCTFPYFCLRFTFSSIHGFGLFAYCWKLKAATINERLVIIQFRFVCGDDACYMLRVIVPKWRQKILGNVYYSFYSIGCNWLKKKQRNIDGSDVIVSATIPEIINKRTEKKNNLNCPFSIKHTRFFLLNKRSRSYHHYTPFIKLITASATSKCRQ